MCVYVRLGGFWMPLFIAVQHLVRPSLGRRARITLNTPSAPSTCAASMHDIIASLSQAAIRRSNQRPRYTHHLVHKFSDVVEKGVEARGEVL